MATTRILIITTGGTILQEEKDGRMHIALSTEDLTESIAASAELTFFEVSRRAGAEMTFETLLTIRDRIKAASDVDGVVLITGTDSMEEVAFALDILLEPAIPVVVTGAMKPSDILGYDGVANLSDAVAVASCSEATGLGVLVVLNDSVHPARYVRKQDSALIGSFQSHPGPIGQIRRGRPIFYYTKLPEMQRFPNVPREKFIQTNILLWTMVVDPWFPETALDNGVDGLIIAGMGTGSVAKSVVDQLSPRWTSCIPIVLSSRCPIGLSFDDSYYRGSREKYESLGFRILGYETLNPLQARLKLACEVASEQ